jgi:hypothetical protein
MTNDTQDEVTAAVFSLVVRGAISPDPSGGAPNTNDEVRTIVTDEIARLRGSPPSPRECAAAQSISATVDLVVQDLSR